MCAFCKYGIVYSCCDGTECTHPLNGCHGFPSYETWLEPGQDCWGFRPSLNISVMADIVGIILQNEADEWFYSVKKDGSIVVRYTKVKEKKEDAENEVRPNR